MPRILLEEGLDGSVTWVIEQGAVGGVPFLGFQFGCAQNPDALLASPDQFTYLQGGGFDRALLSFLEVDADGNVNVSRLDAKPHVTAGVGGFVDITARAKRIVFSGYFTAGAQLEIEDGQHGRSPGKGKHQRFVPEVQHVTFSGRRARELGSGGRVRHRAVRDPAAARGPHGDGDRPRHQRHARHHRTDVLDLKISPDLQRDGRAALPTRADGPEAAGAIGMSGAAAGQHHRLAWTVRSRRSRRIGPRSSTP